MRVADSLPCALTVVLGGTVQCRIDTGRDRKLLDCLILVIQVIG